MADLTDAEIARRLAEAMGWYTNPNEYSPSQLLVRRPGQRRWFVFNPLADTREGWGDFGEVWEWACTWVKTITLVRPHPDSGYEPQASFGEGYSHDPDPCRALCLAILQALESDDAG